MVSDNLFLLLYKWGRVSQSWESSKKSTATDLTETLHVL